MSNESILELLTQLGVFHSKRKDLNSKLRFLSVIQEYLSKCNIKSDIYKLNDKKKSLSMIIGDVESSNVIYMTHFDTPKWSMLQSYKPGDLKFLKRENIFSILISIVVLVVLSMPFLYLSKIVWTDGVLDYKDFLLFFYMVAIIFFIRHSRNGFYRMDTLVRNTSSVVALVEFVRRNPTKTVVFIDYGCEDLYGYYQFIKKYPDKNIIYLDSIGYGSVKTRNINKNTSLIAPKEMLYKNEKLDISENIKMVIDYLEDKRNSN